jgi:hypothetical protein
MSLAVEYDFLPIITKISKRLLVVGVLRLEILVALGHEKR